MRPVGLSSLYASLVTMSDARIGELDKGAVDTIVERSRGRVMTGEQKRAAVNDVLLSNRQLKNKPDGYWILDPSGGRLGTPQRDAAPC